MEVYALVHYSSYFPGTLCGQLSVGVLAYWLAGLRALQLHVPSGSGGESNPAVGPPGATRGLQPCGVVRSWRQKHDSCSPGPAQPPPPNSVPAIPSPQHQSGNCYGTCKFVHACVRCMATDHIVKDCPKRPPPSVGVRPVQDIRRFKVTPIYLLYRDQLVHSSGQLVRSLPCIVHRSFPFIVHPGGCMAFGTHGVPWGAGIGVA